MAKTIGQLTQATTIGGSDEFVIEQTGITKRVAASVVRGGLVNADVASNAAIAFSKLAALDSANILVGNGSNVATKVAVSGDATISNAGAVTLAASAVNGKTALTDPLASTDEFLIWDASASALRKVTWNSLQPAGSVLQTVQVVKTTLQNCSTAIPYDDTIPQNTEGDEIFTATITPSSASNKILVSVVACGLTSSSTTGGSVAALFKDSGANAIAVGNLVPYFYSGSSVIKFLDAPATTSAITYKVRAGSNTGSFYLNGTYLGVQLYGGAQTSSITLQEIKG
jgi:hypothetical protein